VRSVLQEKIFNEESLTSRWVELDPLVPNLSPHLDPTNENDKRVIVAFFEEFLIAERSARNWFNNTSNPKIVRNTEVFDGSREYLVKEEEEHVQLCNEVLHDLGAENAKPNQKSVEFWSNPGSGFDAMFPLTPAQAALLATISEGLGMIFMLNLEAVLKESVPKKALHKLTTDEIGHLSACEIIIKETLAKNASANKELLFTLDKYFYYSREPARAQKKLVEAAGIDYYQVSRRMLEINLDRIESLGLNLGFKWGSARKFASRAGLMSLLLRFYL
jgi:hypothetical protein